MRQVALLIGVLAAVAVGHSQTQGEGGRTSRAAAPAQASAPTRTAAAAAVHPVAPPDGALVQKYCVTCHSDRLKTGGLSLQGVDPAAPKIDGAIWEQVVQKLHGGMMPPQGMPRPDAAALDAFVRSLEAVLDRQAASTPNPGHKPPHRLNRTEYGHAIRDLLDLDIDASSMLPADDESNGFDNIAGVLRVSPSLLEQYLGAARKVSSLAVGTDKDVIRLAFRIPPDDSQEDQVDGLPIGTRGGLSFTHTFPQDAEYEFSVFLLRNIVGYMIGLEFAHQLEISIDGERVFMKQVGGEEDNLASDKNMSEAANAIDARLKTRVRVKAGPRTVAITFVKRNHAESDEPLQPHERNHDLQDMNGLPQIDHVNLTGPFDPTGPGDTPSRRRVFTCKPTGAADETACARRVLSALAKRAYRRPVTADDMAPVMEQYEAGRKGGSFDTGVEHGLRLILANPKFLFRVERAADKPGPVSDLELASRLSFFLWSSIPDEALIDAAASGRLSTPAGIERQVTRMLADPRSRALTTNFASQWLLLRNLKNHVPTPGDFPNFDNELRQAFRRETELFFGSVVEENRSVLDLINANYTFVNERLARHYGIKNVYGSNYRRVTVTNEARRGLLGQGSVLTVTSYPNRTSPVLRGKYILENILGTPPPAPPANVPALSDNEAGHEPKSLRERLELHRASPACASCHRVMDPLGFALENFDGIGAWRAKEPGGAIDPSGKLADGSNVDGPVALRAAIMRHPDQFVRTLTEKLMTYGLGRGLEYYDMPVVRGIARDAAKKDYRFSAIVAGIVSSPPFRQKAPQGSGAQLVASH
jgi:cytochrome c5